MIITSGALDFSKLERKEKRGRVGRVGGRDGQIDDRRIDE